MPEQTEREIWKSVIGYEGIYSISSLGRFRRDISNTNVKAGRVTNGCKDRYYKISLRKNGVRKHQSIHVLVIEAFIGIRPKGMYVHHVDGNKYNNRISNLRYVTPKQNIGYSVIAGTHPKGSKVGNSKLHEKDIPIIRNLLKTKSDYVIARIFKVMRETIKAIKENKTWRHVTLRLVEIGEVE